jgi:hypothetical protein
MKRKLEKSKSWFDALPAKEKERIYREIDESPPGKIWAESKSRSMTAVDRKRFEKVRRKLGRPKIGRGVKVVSVSVEADLLESADAYAKQAGIGRTELFVQGLRLVMASKSRPVRESA